MITYQTNLNNISPDKLNGFFVGCPNPPSNETFLKILENSSHIVLAIDIDSGDVIGFINAVSDNILAAYLPLLEVLPEYQKQGIGTELVKQMLELLKDFYMIDLACDEDLLPFYKKFDLTKICEMAGKRNFDKQSGV